MKHSHRTGAAHSRAARLLFATILAAVAATVSADSRLPRNDEQLLADSAAALRGTVLATRSFRDPATGRIWTDVWLRTDETFKGSLPRVLRLRQPGGTVADGGEFTTDSPPFAAGEERLVRLARRADGSAFALGAATGAPVLTGRPGRARPDSPARLRRWRQLRHAGPLPGLDLTASDGTSSLPATAQAGAPVVAEAVTASGLITDANGIPARNPEVDHGAPIPYLVDTDRLPAGLSATQALASVRNALAAWAAVSGVRFRFEGTTSFGQGADDVVAADGKLRIQLHDTYGSISGGLDVLGIGGTEWGSYPALGGAAGEGGRVGTQEFHRVLRSFVVISHTAAALQNPKTFEEVLCHEIGHTLGLAHSSETSTETDATLREAIMFAYAHADDRGAALGSYDAPVVRLAYPTTGRPPWTTERVMRVVTNPGALTFPGANTIQLRAFDLDTPTASLVWTHNYTSANSGAFSRNGAALTFTPNAYYGDASLDPAAGTAYAYTYVRASDGVNASPWRMVRLVAFAPDNHPTGGDGLPDAWMSTHFGSPDPGAGTGRGPADDPDGDGFTNLQELQMDTDPLDPESRLQITAFTPDRLEWNPRPYEFYHLEYSHDLTTWASLPATATQPETDIGAATDFADPEQPRGFYRVRFAP